MSGNGKNIVIVGAGFGGVTAALSLASHQALAKAGFTIILIDRHHHQLYTPALYEIAAIPSDYAADPSLKAAALIPFADIVRGKPIQFLSDEFIGLDAATKKIVLRKHGPLAYTFLILALGSETNYFDIPGLKEHSLALKTPEDAVRLRNVIEQSIDKESLNIIIGGAGSSGVELIAEFINFLCLLQERRHAHDRHVCNIQFTLVEAAHTILPGFDRWVVAKARQRLISLGIRIKAGASITAVTAATISFSDGTTSPFDILIWTGGVRGPSLLETLGLPLSSKKALVVDAHLRVEGRDAIFAIGDNATFTNPPTGTPLVWNVPAAEAEARHVAKNITRIIRGKQEKKFVPLRRYPFILAVGKKYAIADLIFFKCAGLFGWLAKILVELRYLLFILPPHSALSLWWQDVKLYRSND